MYSPNYPSWVYIVAAAWFIFICYLAVNEPWANRREKKSKHNAPQTNTKPYNPSKPKAKPKPVQNTTKPCKRLPSPETLEAMHKQADAERAIAEALYRKASYTPDPVKRARLEKQAAAAETRFNSILDKIDAFTQPSD